MIARLFLFLFLAVTVYGQGMHDQVAALAEYSIDTAREIAVNDYDLELTYGMIHLEKGLLYLTGYVDSTSPTAAYFQGEGEFVFWAVDEIEAQQINRFYRADSISVRFDECYFAFPGRSPVFAEIRDDGQALTPSYRVKTMFNGIRDIPGSKFKYNLPLNLYAAIAEGKEDFLWIDVRKERYQHTVYVYDPDAIEQVNVYKYTSNFKRPQVVSSVRDTTALRPRDYAGQYHIESYAIDVDISTTDKSSFVCTMQLEALQDSMKVARLVLPEAFEVDSVRGDIVADSVPFVRNKNRTELGIELSRYFMPGETCTLTVYYRGNLFRHYVDLGVVQDYLLDWYPTSGRRQLSDYTVRYTIDTGFDFLAVGRLVSDTIIEDRQVSEYRSLRPLAYVSFNYGVFNIDTIATKPTPVILYSLKKDKSPLFGRRGINNVIADVTEALAFYSEHISVCPFDTVRVDAMATGFGQGSPGVIHLAEATFDHAVKGIDDKFRAHEAAHQWWGHLVGPFSYRDVWLSEGLAEYSAAWFIREGRDDTDTFREILRDWQKKIMRRGKLYEQKSIGFRAGAIALGARLGGEMSPGDHVAINYYKAAYMMHMLRLELTYLERDPGAFQNMLRDFLHQHANKLATTSDFVEVARDYLGDVTDRFFGQWLYDWRVPKIKSTWQKQNDGSAEIIIDVQEVGPEFETPYPVRFMCEDGTRAEKWFLIKAGENRLVYSAGVGTRITRVEFNPEYDILEQ
ncbi:MAG: hypothetical protein JW763_07885 [candidate division Zixibacteria bacterium]|nr:hypothetical protein [candidate division Zixibacteria bacterium]